MDLLAARGILDSFLCKHVIGNSVFSRAIMKTMGRLLNSSAFPQPVMGPSGMKPHNTIPVATALRGRGVNSAAKVASPLERAEGDSLRKLAFRAGLGLLFVMVAVLPELLASILHINTYLLYIVAPPAIFGAVFTGGLGRTLQHRAGWMWVGFFCCMMISVPFSSWMGDSFGNLKGYAEFSLPLLFTIGGLTLNFREVRSTFYAIGAGGLIVISAARLFAAEDHGRIDMTSASGTIGNSNDLASHLILVLPFLLFIGMDRRRAAVIRYSMIVPAAYAFWIIFGTASRGAVIALVASFLFVLVRGSAKQRVAALAVGAILAVSIPFLIRGNAADRLASMVGGKHVEAEESEEARSYLLKQSLLYTVQHPIFGIGLRQFANYEGKVSLAAGKIGNWHQTHNSFTQVSSECGIPALIFFVLGIGSAFLSVNRTYRKARREGYPEIANACFCYLLSMVGYVVSIAFLSNAYRFYLPAMIGLAIALSTTAEREMSGGRLNQPVRAAG
jgi:O-antigen ligase